MTVPDAEAQAAQARDPQAALDRVRNLAREWATLADSPGIDAQIDARVGRELLDVIHGAQGSVEQRLRLVSSMAEGWLTPGASLFCPAAGQRVLNAIKGDAAGSAAGPRVTVAALEAALTDRDILVRVGNGIELRRPARPRDLALQLLTAVERAGMPDAPGTAEGTYCPGRLPEADAPEDPRTARDTAAEEGDTDDCEPTL